MDMAFVLALVGQEMRIKQVSSLAVKRKSILTLVSEQQKTIMDGAALLISLSVDHTAKQL